MRDSDNVVWGDQAPERVRQPYIDDSDAVLVLTDEDGDWRHAA